jgi:hypothetical protein
VRAAIEAGEIDPERLRSYRELQDEAALERRRADALAEQAERRAGRSRGARPGGRRRQR